MKKLIEDNKRKLRFYKMFLLIVTSIVLIALSACGREKEESIDQYLWNQVLEYTIAEEQSDGTVIVTLTAPDYGKIIANKVSSNAIKEVTSEVLAEAVEENSDSIKEYKFTVSSSDEAAIQVAFFEQIAYDLMIEAINGTEYVDELQSAVSNGRRCV